MAHLSSSVINTADILRMSAKLSTLGFLKMKVFGNKSRDVIFYVNNVTNKTLSRNSNHIVDVVMRPKFGNSRTFV